ncbi:hypothetical protein BHE74_00048337, partial [Ensete ventricosum]
MGQNRHQDCSQPCSNLFPNHSSQCDSSSQSGDEKGGGPGQTSQGIHTGGAVHSPDLSVVITQPEEEVPHPGMSISQSKASEANEKIGMMAATSAVTSLKVFLPRSESCEDQCRYHATLPSNFTSYWIWRVNSDQDRGQQENERV